MHIYLILIKSCTETFYLGTFKGEVIVDFVIIIVQIKSWGCPLTDLTPPPFCACPKPGPGFTTSSVMVFFVFSELR
jgi:hypothetical protein